MKKPFNIPLMVAITLDLEPFGNNENPKSCPILNDQNLWDGIQAVLKKHQVKSTVFVVGRVLEENPSIIPRFQSANTEFELHSHSHNIADTDSQQEIEQACNAYVDYFGKKPLGYRAPWGKISKEGLKRLEQKGFKYDSSIIPSFRPGVFNHLSAPLYPYPLQGSSLMEIPFSVVPGVRMILGMSYLKFFRFSLYRFLLNCFGFPNPLVFYMHLHDFKIDREILGRQNLAGWEKFYHASNVKNSLAILNEFLSFLKKKNYQFVFMSQIYQTYIESTK